MSTSSDTSASSEEEESDTMIHIARCYGPKKSGAAGAGGDGDGDPGSSTTTHFQDIVKDLKDIFEGEESTSVNVNEGFAKIINGALRRKPGEEATKKLLEAYPRPANIENLQVPRTNQDVWDSLRRGSAIVDGNIQKIQALLGRSCSATIQLIDQVGSGSGGTMESHLAEVTDIVRGICTSFSSLNQVRKDIVRNELGEPMARLCSWDTPVGADTLFEGDVGKMIKEREDGRAKIVRRKKRFFKK